MTQSSTTQPVPSANYYSAIDGLRAIAVMSVFLFHLKVPGFEWGWSGVQMFFVISGFLITGILIDSIHHPHYFRNFYIRRSLRIFPIYYLTLFALLIYGLVRGVDVSWQYFPYFLTYTQNYIQPLLFYQVGYWSSLPHTWSLAVEEQFYLMWPLIIYLAKPQRAKFICVFFIVGAVMWRIITRNTYASFSVQTTWVMMNAIPSYVDTLSIGAMITFGHRALSKKALQTIAYVGIVCGGLLAFVLPRLMNLSVPWQFWIEHYFVYYLGNSALGGFYGGLLILALTNAPIISHILNFKWLRAIGRISYGIYLYHMLIYLLSANIFQSFTNRFPEPIKSISHDLAVVAITLCVAFLSWRFIEHPINELKDKFAAYRKPT
jgi:peptidoglycan/LPS O-acetylase OafA/YrhL